MSSLFSLQLFPEHAFCTPFQITPRSEGAESPGNRLDTHIVRSHLGPVESEALSICILPRPPCDSFFF